MLDRTEYMVLADSEMGPFALPADCALGIVPASRGVLQPAGEAQPAVHSGQFVYRDKTFMVLDIDMLTIRLIQAPSEAVGLSRGAGRHQ